MRFHRISVLVAFSLSSLAKPFSPPWDDMHTKHSWKVIPDKWESLGHPPSGTAIDLYVALKPRREKALTDALYEVSSPGHPKYGAHLSKEQVAALVAPHPNTLELVKSWLEHHGVPPSSVSMTHGGNTLMLEGVSMAQANVLLGASYQLYRHIESSETIVRTVSYALPAALHGHVLTVAPTTSFVSPPTQRQTPRNGSGGTAAKLVHSASGKSAKVLSSRIDVRFSTPSFLRWLYDTSTYRPAAADRNVLGIVGFNGDYPSPSDLAAFVRKSRPDAVGATYTVVKVTKGGYNPRRPSVEANLDIQYTQAMAYPTPQVFYSIGSLPQKKGDWLINWLQYILDQSSIPQTISTSYGQYEKTVSKEYASYVCELFAQLGARGVSVLFSAGNFGVGQDDDCVTDDGSVRFSPFFPGTCPWVTVVGGTTGYLPEVAASFSGGGFSEYFDRPKYQERAVSTFLQVLGNRYQGLYNTTGRGIPDIATQAIGFRFFLKGEEYVANGTSGAAPVMAGIISLVNDYLISKGRRPLGYLNPWLYGVGFQALLDITRGSNPGCGTDGFPAVEGWDPVTGLGTPNLGIMLKLLGGWVVVGLALKTALPVAIAPHIIFAHNDVKLRSKVATEYTRSQWSPNLLRCATGSTHDISTSSKRLGRTGRTQAGTSTPGVCKGVCVKAFSSFPSSLAARTSTLHRAVR